MYPPSLAMFRKFLDSLLVTLKTFCERTANWVIELTWMKFFLFAILILIIGGMTEDLLPSVEKVVTHKKLKAAPHQINPVREIDHNADIEINSSGIHVRENKSVSPVVPLASNPADDGSKPAATPSNPTTDHDAIHVTLPPGISNEIAKEINDEIKEANDQIAKDNAQEVVTYREEKSTWLMGLVMITLVSLFGVKALMGGKRRAELSAQAAQQNAERESLQRQVAEAKMQMMQAQIEPHFLFNTLASVEHLIETDPPRAAAMQRSLIQYLRAVIPQMRDTTSSTNLGRELAIVREYLTLLKMRMEERLEFTLSVPEGLNSAVFPAMMLQTLVENAIKHGLEPKADGGNISVSAEVAHNKLRVSVVDNGLGFGAVASNGTGLGLQNIRERLALLYQGNHQFTITPGIGGGMAVTIEIPYRYSNS